MSLKLGFYRHFKGNRYQVIDVAQHSETLEHHVVYRALYGEKGLWIRPLEMFVESIERDGKTFKRFQYEDDVV
ncbi:MAG: cyclomaltodextrinase [Enterobacterales bacterium]|jgi:cyclomaltodextrinase